MEKRKLKPFLIQFFGFQEHHLREIVPNCIFFGINLSDLTEANKNWEECSAAEENIVLRSTYLAAAFGPRDRWVLKQ